jgi:hypothetical protein
VRTWRFVVFFVSLSVYSIAVDAQTLLKESEKSTVISAIEDEIYDYGLQEKFRSVGKAITAESFEIPLFVTRDSQDGNLYLIYRLMPFGEMYRLATIGPDGQVRLFRKPRSGFPPDAPAMLTAYYDDDQICRLKHEALRLSFIVEMTPSKARIAEVIVNQKHRYGFSNIEETKLPKRAPSGQRK